MATEGIQNSSHSCWMSERVKIRCHVVDAQFKNDAVLLTSASHKPTQLTKIAVHVLVGLVLNNDR